MEQYKLQVGRPLPQWWWGGETNAGRRSSCVGMRGVGSGRMGRGVSRSAEERNGLVQAGVRGRVGIGTEGAAP